MIFPAFFHTASIAIHKTNKFFNSAYEQTEIILNPYIC